MKILYWNGRGFGNADTRSVLKKLCMINKPDFVFLLKPWIEFDDVPSSFWRQLYLQLFFVNNRGSSLPNLWGLCNPLFARTMIANSWMEGTFIQVLFMLAQITS